MATRMMDDMNGKHLGWIKIENGTVVDYNFDHCPVCKRPFQQGGSDIMKTICADPRDPIFECGTCGNKVLSSSSSIQSFALNPAD